MKKLTLLSFILFASMFIIGCDLFDQTASIIGTWDIDSRKDLSSGVVMTPTEAGFEYYTMTFSQDGTFSLEGVKNGNPFSDTGNWADNGDGTYEVTDSSGTTVLTLVDKKTFTYSVNGFLTTFTKR